MKKKTLIIFIVILLLGVCVYKNMSSTNIKHYNSNVVILDAGHGGSDTGATESGINEKDINLNAVKMIGNYLEEFGIEVIYTRNDDQRLCNEKFEDLKLRAEMSKKYKAEYYVSIHVNDYEEVVSGFEIYINDDNYARELAKSIGKEFDKLNYSENRGIKDGTHLRVLRLNTSPAILIELGYINSKDINYLINNNKLEKLCKAISEGIIERVK